MSRLAWLAIILLSVSARRVSAQAPDLILHHGKIATVDKNFSLAEAIAIVRNKQRADGRWPLENRYQGKAYFQLERLGAPSRWNTLRALRVLNWWEARRV